MTKKFSQPEATTVLDITVCFVLIAVTVALLTLIIYAKVKAKKWMSIKARSPDMIFAITVTGIIWMWSAFIANEHLPFFSLLNKLSCTLWTIWMQYCFGLNLMLSILVGRLHYYYTIGGKGFMGMTAYKSTNIIMILCSLPVFIMAMGIEYNVGVERADGTCHTRSIWKYALSTSFLLVLFIVVLYVVMGVSVLRRRIVGDYRELRKSIILSSPAIALVFILTLTSQNLTSIGRSVIESCIMFCVCMLFWGLCGSALLAAFRDEVRYEEDYKALVNTTNIPPKINSLNDVFENEGVYRFFIEWLKNRAAPPPAVRKEDLKRVNIDDGDLIGINFDSSDLSSGFYTSRDLDDEEESFSSSADPITNTPLTGVLDKNKKEYFKNLIAQADPKTIVFHPKNIAIFLNQLRPFAYNELPGTEAEINSVIDQINKTHLCVANSEHVFIPSRLTYSLRNQSNYLGKISVLKIMYNWLFTQIKEIFWTEFRDDEENGLGKYFREFQMYSDVNAELASDNLTYEPGPRSRTDHVNRMIGGHTFTDHNV